MDLEYRAAHLVEVLELRFALLGVLDHGPELIEAEHATTEAAALLHEDGAAA